MCKLFFQHTAPWVAICCFPALLAPWGACPCVPDWNPLPFPITCSTNPQGIGKAGPAVPFTGLQRCSSGHSERHTLLQTVSPKAAYCVTLSLPDFNLYSIELLLTTSASSRLQVLWRQGPANLAPPLTWPHPTFAGVFPFFTLRILTSGARDVAQAAFPEDLGGTPAPTSIALVLSSGLRGHQASMWYTNTHAGKTPST